MPSSPGSVDESDYFSSGSDHHDEHGHHSSRSDSTDWADWDGDDELPVDADIIQADVVDQAVLADVMWVPERKGAG